MMRILLCILSILIALTTLNAQNFGYLDRNALFAEMPEMIEVNTKLSTLQGQLQKKKEAMVAEVQEEFARIQHLISNACLTPDALDQLRVKMQSMIQEVYFFDLNMKSQIDEAETDLKQPLFNKVSAAISEVAEEIELQYIFDQGTRMILFAEQSTNVTGIVKSKL